MIEAKVNQLDDLYMYEIFRNPILLNEFVENFDKTEREEPFELTFYQKEFLADFSSYVSIMAGRSSGKTVSVVGMIRWILTFNVFPNDYICYLVPNRSQLEPVFTGLVRSFRSNTLLKQFISPSSGINSSDYKITLLNMSTLICKISGQTGDGRAVIATHTPFFVVDECVPAETRIAMPHCNKSIHRIKPGDKVLSWNGEYIEEDTVVTVRKTEREQRILEIGYEGGSIKVGENHRMFNGTQYVEAKDLVEGDALYIHTNVRRAYFTDYEKDFVYECIKNGKDTAQIGKLLNRSTKSIDKFIRRNYGKVCDLRDSFSLSEEEYQIILGSFLGDGSAEVEPFRARYRTNHSLKQKAYVDWLVEKLQRLVRTPPRIAVNGGYGDYNYCFGTIGHKEILEIAESLIINGKKTITREYLDKLSPLGLAVWFMDDGSHCGMFSTHCFSKEENEIIVQYLKEKWNIDSRVCEDKRVNLFYVGIRNSSLCKLKDIIYPYMPDCMKYKFGEGKYNNTTPEVSIIPKSEDISTLEERTITYIKDVTNGHIKFIYNIEVEKNHNYFADGVLTKNSGYQPWGTWIELQPTVNTFTPGYRLVVAGVPDGRREKSVCFFADMISSNYSKHRISSDLNPRLTEKDRQQAIEQYGGEDSDDFIHLWKAEHGKPVFALFDRGNFAFGDDPVYKLTLNGTQIGEMLSEYLTKIDIFPSLPSKEDKAILCVDLGYTEPTAIIILYQDRLGRLRFHGRIEMTKVSYPIQEKLLNVLDSKFHPALIGIDRGAGGQGISVVQHMMEDLEYAHKDYQKRLVPVDFSTSIVIGIDSDGNEIKSKTKPFATSVLQEYANNHKIMFSHKDLEMVNELERMTYSRTPTGEIVYKTLTQKGGKSGSDHFTAALLCGIMAYYIKNDFMLYKSERKILARPSWV
jgi:hypothetical protein